MTRLVVHKAFGWPGIIIGPAGPTYLQCIQPRLMVQFNIKGRTTIHECHPEDLEYVTSVAEVIPLPGRHVRPGLRVIDGGRA